MVPRCARCGTPAASFMTFDYGRQSVWLQDFAAVVAGPGHALCANHADRLSPPQGWTLTDLREVAPLFAYEVA